MFLANNVNNAPGGRRRGALMLLAFFVGLALIWLTASQVESLVPQIGLLNGVIEGLAGLTFMAFVADGAFSRVWQNLVGVNLDYANRFFPLAGSLIGLALLGLWGWKIHSRWLKHDVTTVVDIACFGLGAICLFIGGKRLPKPIASAVIA